jgi:large subunit ribosomal protein L19
MKLAPINSEILKKDIPQFSSGDTLKVYQKIKEGDKGRIQVFEGLVISRHAGSGIDATFTIRKIASGVGVERIFPLHSPNIAKLEVVKKGKVTKANIYYVRGKHDNQPRFRKGKPVAKSKK